MSVSEYMRVRQFDVPMVRMKKKFPHVSIEFRECMLMVHEKMRSLKFKRVFYLLLTVFVANFF